MFALAHAWPAGTESFDVVAVCAPPETDIFSAPCSGDDFEHASVAIYQGLDQDDLELVWLTPGNVTDVRLALNGIAFPVPANEFVKWGVDHPAIYDQSPFLTPSGEAFGTTRWGQSPELRAAVAAIHFQAQVQSDSGGTLALPTGYKGLGRTEGTLKHSLVEPSRFAVGVEPLSAAETPVKGSIESPNGYLVARTAFISSQGSIRFEVGLDTRRSQPSQFEFLPPRGLLAGACTSAKQMDVPAEQASTSHTCGFAAEGSVGALTLLPGPTLAEPASGGEVAAPGTLRWTVPSLGLLSIVKMTISGSETFFPIDVRVYTSKNEFQMPDLSRVGITLPPAASVRWSVTSTTDFTLEDQVKGNAKSWLFPVAPVAGGRSWFGESGSRTFRWNTRATL